MPRIERITIQGFRSFGAEGQELDLTSDLAVVWGPNSEGKTSLAEALEFLFTGTISRRRLLASSRDEFAESLRNAHMDPEVEAFVEALITPPGGRAHTLRRTLVQDFARRHDCSSRLDLNGVPVDLAELARIGVDLSEPPLAAPVLMQHNLLYLFSARPQERSVYFKTLLETTDLEELRAALRGLSDSRKPDTNTHSQCFGRCLRIPQIEPYLAPLESTVPTAAAVETAVSDGIGKLLSDAGETPPPTPVERVRRLEVLISERRSATFPLHGFRRRTEQLSWNLPDEGNWTALGAFSTALRAVDEKTKQLVSIFDAVLLLPAVSDAAEAVDCPVCETPDGLTPERIRALREIVSSNAGLQSAEAEAMKALRTFDEYLKGLEGALEAASPQFIAWSRARRISEGFRTSELPALLDNEEAPLLVGWFRAASRVMRTRRKTGTVMAEAGKLVASFQEEPMQLRDGREIDRLRSAVEATEDSQRRLEKALESYKNAVRPLREPLTSSVDARSSIAGWADLVQLGQSAAEVAAALVDRRAEQTLLGEFDRALRQFDQAKEAVLDEKFEALAEKVRTWWDLLRPGEASFFSDLGLRPGATRTIDFKAGLASSPERRNVKLRDAVAVFSQSQLQCLGLAVFLARAAERGAFVVLDDPIIALDDDYSAHFINSLLARLIEDGVQALILTYDQRTVRAVLERYGQAVEGFHLNLDDPAQGTSVTKSSDRLAMMLKAAQPFTRSSVLRTRKDGCERIRDCGERFCKELLVRKRREQGDANALVTDYTGTRGNLNCLIDEAIPHLTQPDDAGKLRSLRRVLNPGNHDDDVPSKTFLSTYLGYLREFHRRYLL